ncbi:MAG: L-histidine N(alpha)-methyltransferase [Candidatus Peribacteria bacterium]|jgi:hypothetical protein|nr:L-histidine N(alpha)-methyltransferase [Candidatus Peribacteria bacterium]
MYKEVLGIEYLDKEPYSPLDPENTKIQQFRKDHCFVGVDTSKIYENKVVCLHDLGFSPLSTNNYDTYFFDDTNSFYSNDDIFHFLKTKKISSTKKKKPVLLQPEKFKGSSFDIFGNTLLNFDKAGQIRLITTFMQSLGEKTTGFVAIHHQMDEKTLLGLYDTPQERVRRESLIKSDYGLERESAGQQNYEFKFWVDQEGTLEMDIQVLKDVMLSVKGQQVKKKAGTVLHLGESGKMSDESFRAVIDQTDAKITDTMKSNDGKVTIYVLSNKDFDLPEDGLGNFSTTFDQNYAQIVRYQKDQLNEAIDIL